MNNHEIIETSATIKRLSALFSDSFDITDKSNIHKPYYFSVITEILIHLKDITQKLKKLGCGIYFRDNIPAAEIHNDITALVSHFRDAACHNNSLRRRTKKDILYANNVFAGFDFEDEITILMGDSKLFVKRHLLRLYIEILKKYLEYPVFQKNKDFVITINFEKLMGHLS